MVWTCGDEMYRLVVRRTDPMESSQNIRGRESLRKTIIETTKKDLEINELDGDIHVADLV